MQEKYEPTGLTFEKVWKLFQETDEKMKESNKMINLEFKEIAKRFKETDAKFKETYAKFKETDAKFKETDRQMQRLMKSYDRFGSFINNISETIEYFFQDAFSDMLETDGVIKIGGFVFDDMIKNYEIGKKKKKKEVDIILINDELKLLAIIEIKTKLNKDYFENIEKISDYLNYDRIFKQYKYIYGFASSNIPNDCETLAQELGIFLVKPNIKKSTIRRDYLAKFNPKIFDKKP